VSALCAFALRGHGSSAAILIHSQAHLQVLAAMALLLPEAAVQQEGLALLNALAARSKARDAVATPEAALLLPLLLPLPLLSP
jgi:hypothetical protein